MGVAAQNLYSQQGIGGFYRGIEANVMRAMVLNGTKMSCYDQIKVSAYFDIENMICIFVWLPFPFLYASLSLLHSLSQFLTDSLTISKGATVQAMKKPAPKAAQNCVGRPAGIAWDLTIRP